MIHCRVHGGEYRQLFEAVPENGTVRLPSGVCRFMGTTTLVMKSQDGQQFPQEVRFDIEALNLKDAWARFTACETAYVARLIAPSIVMPGDA